MSPWVTGRSTGLKLECLESIHVLKTDMVERTEKLDQGNKGSEGL